MNDLSAQGFRPATAAMADTAPIQTGRVPAPTQTAGGRGPAQPQRLEQRERSGPPPEAAMPNIRAGYASLQGFEFLQRTARSLMWSDQIPTAFRARIPNKRKRDEFIENPAALSNCMVALTMADRMGQDVISVMWNLYIVEGRPSWSGQYVIALVNSSGLYKHPLRFDFTYGEDKEYSYVETYWEDGLQSRPMKIKAPTFSCVAWTLAPDGQRIESEAITTEMCIAEGWYQKKGSKWQTMLGQMARYRAGAFFARVNCPQILYGLPTEDEALDMVEAQKTSSGEWAVRADEEGTAVRDEPGEGGDQTTQQGDDQGDGQTGGDGAPQTDGTPLLTHNPATTLEDLVQGKEQLEKVGVTVTDRQAAPADPPPTGTGKPRTRNLFSAME